MKTIYLSVFDSNTKESYYKKCSIEELKKNKEILQREMTDIVYFTNGEVEVWQKIDTDYESDKKYDLSTFSTEPIINVSKVKDIKENLYDEALQTHFNDKINDLVNFDDMDEEEKEERKDQYYKDDIESCITYNFRTRNIKKEVQETDLFQYYMFHYRSFINSPFKNPIIEKVVSEYLESKEFYEMKKTLASEGFKEEDIYALIYCEPRLYNRMYKDTASMIKSFNQEVNDIDGIRSDLKQQLASASLIKDKQLNRYEEPFGIDIMKENIKNYELEPFLNKEEKLKSKSKTKTI